MIGTTVDFADDLQMKGGRVFGNLMFSVSSMEDFKNVEKVKCRDKSAV